MYGIWAFGFALQNTVVRAINKIIAKAKGK